MVLSEVLTISYMIDIQLNDIFGGESITAGMSGLKNLLKKYFRFYMTINHFPY